MDGTRRGQQPAEKVPLELAGFSFHSIAIAIIDTIEELRQPFMDPAMIIPVGKYLQREIRNPLKVYRTVTKGRIPRII